jgi:hypothetical protein
MTLGTPGLIPEIPVENSQALSLIGKNLVESPRGRKGNFEARLEEDFSSLVEFSFGNLRDMERGGERDIDTHQKCDTMESADGEGLITKESLLGFFRTNSLPADRFRMRRGVEFDEGLTAKMIEWWIKHFVLKGPEPGGENLGSQTLNLENFEKGMKANGFKDLLKSVIAARGIGK